MKIIPISNSREDAQYLIRGFSGPLSHHGEPCRWLSVVSRMHLPIDTTQACRVTLSMASDGPQTALFSVNGEECLRQDLPGDNTWQDLSFEIAAGGSARPVLEIRALKDSHKDAYVAGYLFLRSVSLSAVEEQKPETPASEPEYRILFGDIHVHSNISPCSRGRAGTAADNYKRAKEEVGLDFLAVADHDNRMTDAEWDELKQSAEDHNKDGEFITLFGYEWTSYVFGQLNVYSDDPRLPMIRCTDDDAENPPKLWKKLEDLPFRTFTIFHHPTRVAMFTSWDFWHPDLMPVVEIYSHWGNSEYIGAPLQQEGVCVPGTSVQDALARGHILGFIGSGDMHDLRPGKFGITGVLAEDFTREGIVDAIVERRCYATTGAQIKLGFKLGGVNMGQTIRFTPYTQETLYPLPMEIEITPTDVVESIELICSGTVVRRWGTGDLESEELDPKTRTRRYWLNTELPDICRGTVGAANQCVRQYYYVRVRQIDGETAWSSPVFLIPDRSQFM